MPKAPSAETVRERAHARALKTVQTVIDAPHFPRSIDEPSTDQTVSTEDGHEPVVDKEDSPLPETETEAQETERMPLSNEEYPPEKPRGRPRKAAPIDTQRQQDEDFLEYIARAITPADWSNTLMSGLYGYKIQSGGNLPLFKGVRRPITLEEIKDYAIKHGPGNYRVQLTHGLAHLTRPCGEVFSFDSESLPRNAGQKGASSNSDASGFTEMIKASSSMLEHSAKTAIDLQKDIRFENSKQPDVAGIVTAVVSAVAALIPKQDNTMIQFLITDAQRRADAAEKDADRREQRAKEDAERRERDSERRATEQKAESERQRERDKEFFGLMLKQAESKADSLNQMTGLLTSFMKVKETIDDTMGGGPKGPWDLVGQVADGVLQQGPAIVAALKGAPPAQVAQMQNPQAQPQAPPPFHEMIIRIAKYLQRDPANYNGPYIVDMIEAEYGQVHVDIVNQPKETVLQSIANFEPWGKAIAEHEQANVFMSKVIDAIKFPDNIDKIFPEETEEDEPEIIMVDPKGVATNPRQKRINGRAKGAA